MLSPDEPEPVKKIPQACFEHQLFLIKMQKFKLEPTWSLLKIRLVEP